VSDSAAPELQDGERVLATFTPDGRAYWRSNAALAAAAMAGGMLVLWAIGNPHVWTGAIGGLAAVALRAAYLRSEEMAARWTLTDRRLLGPQGREARLGDIARVRMFAGLVQVITTGGDKHLIKYQSDPAATLARIDGAR
jgi:hypothetical protein